MAEIPKFGAIRTLRQQPAESVDPSQPEEAATPEDSTVGQGRGRRSGGKRSNPNYERMNLLVRKDTRRMVDMKLLQDGSSEDLSELTDRLLREWAS